MGNVKNLFAASGKRFDSVEFLGQKFYVGKITVAQRDRYFHAIQQENNGNRAVAELVQMCTYEDEMGTRAFEDGPDDLALVMATPQDLVDAIAAAIMNFNGVDGKDPVVDAAKNS